MTRKEAIKKLKDILEEATENDNSVCYVTSADADALKVAINSLEIDERYELEYEQIEPCDDCISREWIKTAIHNFYNGLMHVPTEEDIQAYLDVAPSVQPKTDVLDKIRAEILNFKEKCNASDYLGCGILEIIDKYKAESEDME